jgi:hypothetical protein
MDKSPFSYKICGKHSVRSSFWRATGSNRSDYRIHQELRLLLPDGKLHVNVDVDAVFQPKPDFAYSTSSIDPVLFELMCAARFFVESPDIIRLEEVIRAELGMS